MNPSRKKSFLITAAVVMILGVISFALADRYLIRHVEITNVNAYAGTAEAVPVADTSSESTITNTASSTTANTTAVATATMEDITAAMENVSFDDWNYTSDTVSIAITKHTSGSGSDAVTYFVADVTITDATQLSNAFADNQFGRNIIEYTSQIAEENNAIFAINGDYYGFRTDGIIIRNGVIYRDVPARIGLAFYRDGSMKVYDETQTTAEELVAAGVWNTLSFGPALLDDSVIGSNFDTVQVDTNIGNHPIQGYQPRTGIGIIDNNHFVFIVVDGRSKGYSRGVSLDEFAQMFKDLGCTEAYNLDGGGSSTMVFMGRVVNNPLGKNKERGTSDILYIGS